MNTLYGIKQHMTQVWDKTGVRHAVTIIKTEPMQVTQVKTTDKDGYAAYQVGFGQKAAKHITKPLKGHLKAATPRHLREIRETEASEVTIGQTIKASDILTVGDLVAATGVSKGRGFAGAMKRHGFKGGPKTHGQSDRARAVGSIGQGTSPGRVHIGKKMPGHYGVETFTIKNLSVIKVEDNAVWISGAVPGAKGGLIELAKIGTGSFPGLPEVAAEAPAEVVEATEEVVEAPAAEEAATTEEVKTEAAEEVKAEEGKAEEVVEETKEEGKE